MGFKYLLDKFKYVPVTGSVNENSKKGVNTNLSWSLKSEK